MTAGGEATYTLYEDDGNSLAYQRGATARTIVSCHYERDQAEVTIEEQHEHYQPTREWYEVIVQTAERTLQRKVKAGQGKVTIQL